MRRPINDDAAPAQAVFERTGAVGYVAGARVLDGKLYVTEVSRENGMRVWRMDPDGKNAALLVENAGAHDVTPVGAHVAIARQGEDGLWSVALIDAQGHAAHTLTIGDAPCMTVNADGHLLVDEGRTMPPRQRALRVYDGEGALLGACDVPAECGNLLGADGECAYYWETPLDGSAQPRLARVNWRQAAEK